jgi:hypothetical protein
VAVRGRADTAADDEFPMRHRAVPLDAQRLRADYRRLPALKRLLLGYSAATFAVWCAMAVSQYCFEWQNAHHVSDLRLRDTCIAIWFPSSFGLIVLQLACIVMMVSPPRFIRDTLTPRTRIAVGSFAAIVLLTNPWAFILFTVMRGGPLS